MENNLVNKFGVIFKRCWWLYALGILVLVFCVDARQARVNCSNHLQWVADYLEEFHQGKVDFSKDNLRWGVRYYQALEKIFPRNDLILANKAACFLYLGEYRSAAAAYDQAIKLNPVMYTHYWDRGMVAWKMKDAQNAVRFFALSLKVAPQTKVLYDNLGRVLQQQRMGSGLMVLSAAVQQMPQDEQMAYQKLLQLRKEGAGAFKDSAEPTARPHFHPQFMIMLSSRMGQRTP